MKLFYSCTDFCYSKTWKMSFKSEWIITIFIIIHLTKRVLSEESPIVPRGESFFEVQNWSSLLKRDYENQTVVFSKSAKLYEILKDGEEKEIGKVQDNGSLYNDQKDVSLCQRHVFQIKAKGGGESDPFVWTPRSYTSVIPYDSLN